MKFKELLDFLNALHQSFLTAHQAHLLAAKLVLVVLVSAASSVYTIGEERR